MKTNLEEKVFISNDEVPWEQVDALVRRKIMGYDDKLMIVKAEFKTGGIGQLHHHYHSQMTHVESGKFDVSIAGEKSVLKSGDCFYVPPNAVHGAECLEAGVLIDVFSPMREDFIK